MTLLGLVFVFPPTANILLRGRSFALDVDGRAGSSATVAVFGRDRARRRERFEGGSADVARVVVDALRSFCCEVGWSREVERLSRSL